MKRANQQGSSWRSVDVANKIPTATSHGRLTRAGPYTRSSRLIVPITKESDLSSPVPAGVTFTHDGSGRRVVVTNMTSTSGKPRVSHPGVVHHSWTNDSCLPKSKIFDTVFYW
jgi:hypothetical protein